MKGVMKMRNKSKIIYWGILITILVTLLSGVSLAGNTVTIVGTVNAEYQIVDDNGTVYEIADNENGEEVAELVGRKVKVTGNLIDANGTPIITIALYEVIE